MNGEIKEGQRVYGIHSGCFAEVVDVDEDMDGNLFITIKYLTDNDHYHYKGQIHAMGEKLFNTAFRIAEYEDTDLYGPDVEDDPTGLRASLGALLEDNPFGRQVGGDHYKDMAIQPGEYITANKLDWYEGNIVKYISRHRAKGGRQDVEKVIHYAQMLLETYDESN